MQVLIGLMLYCITCWVTQIACVNNETVTSFEEDIMSLYLDKNFVQLNCLLCQPGPFFFLFPFPFQLFLIGSPSIMFILPGKVLTSYGQLFCSLVSFISDASIIKLDVIYPYILFLVGKLISPWFNKCIATSVALLMLPGSFLRVNSYHAPGLKNMML
jgi:hypothetical protein